MKNIFKNDWMQIISDGNRYIIQYNSGDLINSIREVEVSKIDAEIAQKSDENAYNVILKYERYNR